jgi:hypothetical protein
LVLPQEIAQIFQQPSNQRTKQQLASLDKHFRSITPLLKNLRDELTASDKRIAELNAKIPTTLVTETVAPRTVRVLTRGNWMDETGAIVQPAFPEAIAVGSYQVPTGRRLNRLDLASWLVSKQHPLTARVLANRLWKLYFGAGLSSKLEDLGAQGQPPTHPELLDFLANRLIEGNWDIKRFIKMILLTQAYQRTSNATPDSLRLDPTNRLLARQARFRLDAELVRDNVLATSGLLNRQVGGPSVKPYQPPGYWSYLNFPTREWSNDSGANLYRRGLYTHWQRQYLHPSLVAFDAPSREECTADRPRSNTPLQSLALLNDPSYVEAARVLASRIVQQSFESDQAAIGWLFTTALSRPPSPEEINVVQELLRLARSEYSMNSEATKAVAAIGESPSPKDGLLEVATWTAATRALMNLHEFVTRF